MKSDGIDPLTIDHSTKAPTLSVFQPGSHEKAKQPSSMSIIALSITVPLIDILPEAFSFDLFGFSLPASGEDQLS